MDCFKWLCFDPTPTHPPPHREQLCHLSGPSRFRLICRAHLCSCPPLRHSPPHRPAPTLCSLSGNHKRRTVFIFSFKVEALNGTMTSPPTLLCRRQQVTFLVPSLLFRHPSTSRRLRRPGARSRAGLTPRRIPDSPSLPPTSPAFLSHT